LQPRAIARRGKDGLVIGEPLEQLIRKWHMPHCVRFREHGSVPLELFCREQFRA
jgi:hypothetical protein